MPQKRLPLTKIERYVIARVMEIRVQKGLAQKDLAECLGVHVSFISNVENSNHDDKYNVNHLNAIAKLMKISPKEFWPDEGI